MLSVASLLPASAHGQTWGRDYVPYENLASNGHEAMTVYTTPTVLHDAIKVGSTVYVFYGDSGDIKMAEYEPTTGLIDVSGTEVDVLDHSSDSLSYDYVAIVSSVVGLCSKQEEDDDPLSSISTNLYEASRIGINPVSITVSGSGGTCASLQVVPGSFVQGYEDGGSYQYDRFRLQNRGSCTSFYADYDYTNCSLTGTSAFQCEMAVDPDGDGDTEYGFCKFFMVFEGQADTDSDSGTPLDRHFFLAHAQEIDGPWQKYVGDTYPTSSDVLIANTGAHMGGSAGDYSFVSVPDLVEDTGEGVWRMWFVTEDTAAPSVRYSESADDGLSWGIGSYGTDIDCWDSSTSSFDSSACTEIEWTSNAVTPPDDSSYSRDPDIVDPGLVVLDADGDSDLDLGMMFAGADESCSGGPEWGVFLWQVHEHLGDQSGGEKWAWEDSVQADSSYGRVVDRDPANCPSDLDPVDIDDDRVFDPTIVKYATDQYIMFYNDDDSVYVAGSGFECSDFLDNELDGYTDFGDGGDEDCDSPTDDNEAE